jgi:hypothetical protein
MTSTTPPIRARAELALWTGLLGAPAAWSAHLTASYAYAPHACRTGGSIAVLHLISLVCVAVALAGGVISYQEWRHFDPRSPDKTDGGPIARRRFLGALGAIAGAFFTLAMIAQVIAGFFFDPCWT